MSAESKQNAKEFLPLRVLYEDNHLLAIDKPSGLLSQSDPGGDPDALSLAKDYIAERYNKPGAAYLGLVHRLDRSVGGAMVFARTSKAAARLSEQFRQGAPRKIYHALIERGRLAERIGAEEGKLEDYLRKDAKQKIARPAKQNDRDAKLARLRFRVRSSLPADACAGIMSLRARDLPRDFNGIDLVEIELETGRFHQIRFQLSRAGAPILGDRKYGARCGLQDRNARLALHCVSLEIEHPVQKNSVLLESPPPAIWPLRIA